MLRQVLLFLLFPILVGYHLPVQEKPQVTAYVFFAETCPICQSEVIELKAIHELFKARGVKMIAVFPNITMSTGASVKKFARKYGIEFETRLDEGHELTKRFEATHTPQVFVVDDKTADVLYSGKIDNSFERIGQRREVVTEHYLRDALSNILEGKEVSPQKTQPVGCFIIL